MTCKVKINKSFRDKQKRLKRLPVVMDDFVSSLRKQDAARFIRIFHDGIKQDKLGLQKLSDITVENKKALGYRSPSTPLYGKGDDEKKRSFVNMLRVHKIKNGWKVFPSWGRHHKARNIELRQLLKIHETGALIKKGDKIIRIPPRPTFFISTQKFMKELTEYQKRHREIKRELVRFINEGKEAYFKRYMSTVERQTKELEE